MFGVPYKAFVKLPEGLRNGLLVSWLDPRLSRWFPCLWCSAPWRSCWPRLPCRTWAAPGGRGGGRGLSEPRLKFEHFHYWKFNGVRPLLQSWLWVQNTISNLKLIIHFDRKIELIIKYCMELIPSKIEFIYSHLMNDFYLLLEDHMLLNFRVCFPCVK